MRGELRGLLVDRALRHLLLRLVPFHQLGLAGERAVEHFVHARDRNDFEAALDGVGNIDEVLRVLFRDQHRLDAGPKRREGYGA